MIEIQWFYGLVGAAGLFVCLFGYRLFKTALTLTGGGVGAIYCAAVMQIQYGTEQIWPTLLGAVIGGLVGSALALWLYYLSILAAGGYLGFILSGAIIANLELPYPLAVIVGFTLLFALITFVIQRLFIILVTALAGAWHVVVAIGFFFEQRDLLPYQHPYQQGSWIDQVTPMLLLYWALVSLLGFFFQRIFSAKKAPKPAPARSSDVVP